MVTQRLKRLTLDDVLVIDADVHAHETPDKIHPYIDPEWRPALDNAAKVKHRYLNIPGYAPTHTTGGVGTFPSTRGSRVEIVWDAAQMRRELDEFYIDAAVIFPDHFLKIAGVPHAGYAAGLMRAFHRWIDTEWLAEDNGLYGVITAIPQDIDEAVREIDRYARNDRWVGVFLPTCQVYPMWGNEKYFPIFERAQYYDLPVILHSVSGQASGFPFNVEQFSTVYTNHTASHVMAMMANMMNMLETNVPLRFPDLRVCFAESGLAWVPWLRMRLDKEYGENRNAWPAYTDRPSKWIKKFYFATQPVEEPENRQDLVDLIRIFDGDDTTVFASDWPHHDFDHPRAVFDLPVTDLIKRNYMGANALRLMPRIKVPVKYQGAYRQGHTL